MTKVTLAGGAGYTAGELIRILLHHPEVMLTAVQSTSNAGNPVAQVHTDLAGDTDLRFSAEADPEADVLFLCMGHGQSRAFLEANPHLHHLRIIDLSQDYRLLPGNEGFVYGLPEQHRTEIRQARHIANPGCFATAIQLALLPLAASGWVQGPVHLSGITGSTGAGQKPTETTHFSWRSANISHYKLFSHQHLQEVSQLLRTAHPSNAEVPVYFVPYRGNFARGILVTAYLPFEGSLTQLQELYAAYYAGHPFTHVTDRDLDVKMVTNTNKCLLQVQLLQGQAVITAVIDNLLKGASGQAVQNLNLMMDWEETTGLKLKGSAF
ncbi:MAG: N-acetyl-gamma-glutamyl-phosphate reductase [Bacteroidetes bacterium]|nr:N-acetyl-gamma-glutamyl-phosphate reductase [Bacteroidota bacterium]